MMKIRMRFLIPAVLILVCLILGANITSVLSQEEEPDPCGPGDLLLDIGNLEEAEKFFYKLLQENANETCAHDGLEEVSKKRQYLLDLYLQNGNYEKASQLIYGVLALRTVEPMIAAEYPMLLTKIAPTITPLPTATPTPMDYKVAEVYWEIGRPDLAYVQLQTAVAANPISTKITKFENRLWMMPDWWINIIKSYLLYILIALLLVYWLVRLFFFRTPRFDIGDFCTENDKEKELAEKLKFLIEREIIRCFENNPNERRTIIDKPLSVAEVNFETSIFPKELTNIYSFLKKLFPQRVVTLNGTLLSSKTMGKGLVLRLINHKGNVIDECTFWQVVYDTKAKTSEDISNCTEIDCYLCFTKPAAIWTLWFIINKYRLIAKKANKRKLLKTFGTVNLDSGLQNYLGAEQLSQGKYQDAEKSFDNSLQYDNLNLQALFNLANLEIERQTRGILKIIEKNVKRNQADSEEEKQILAAYNNVIKKFIKLIDLYQANFGKKCKNEFIYAFSNYHLGAIFKYLYVFMNFNETCEIKDRSLVEKHIPAISGSAEKPFALINLSTFFFNRAYSCLICPDGAMRSMMVSPTISSVNYKLIEIANQTIQNLGIYDPKKDKQILPLTEFEASEFIGYEKYNLACYYSSMAGKLRIINNDEKIAKESMEKALMYLGLEPADLRLLTGWKAIDPSLYPLRVWVEEKHKISKMQKEFQYPHGLETMQGMSPVYLNRLKVWIGLKTSDDLLRTGSQAIGRKFLVEQTGIPSEFVYGWIKQADLMRIPWVNGKFALLLVLSGVNSVRELRSKKANSLYQKMETVNKEYRIVEKVPEERFLTDWIRKAGEIELILEPD